MSATVMSDAFRASLYPALQTDSLVRKQRMSRWYRQDECVSPGLCRNKRNG